MKISVIIPIYKVEKYLQHTEFFLENDTVFIENTDEYTIFVHVKATHLLHRH